MKKRWEIHPKVSDDIKRGFSGIDDVSIQLLVNRGLSTQEEFDEFFRSDWKRDVHDPFLMPNMNKAVGRIFKAIEEKERIVVFGDYDADGTCGATIILETLNRLGADYADSYIPHRESEGYGLNIEALEKIKSKNTSLIITVDLGIGNIEEIEWANDNGLDVIVVDHHEFRETEEGIILPDAYAIVHANLPNSEYPCKHLSGGGVAFKLAQALLDNSMEDHEAYEKWLLDLVAISTIADVVPIIEENRTLVKYGLMVLNKTQREGLKKLIEVSKINGRGNGSISSNNRFNLDSWNVAFQLAPRINSPGRISHADNTLALLRAKTETDAEKYALLLNSLNSKRQKLAEKIYKEASEQIGEVSSGKYLLSAYKPDWQIGIVGLVAGRISSEFNRPVILLTDSGDNVSGSGRSVAGYDMKKGLDEVREYVVRAGGHAMACGMTVKKEKMSEFVSAFSEVTRKMIGETNLEPLVQVDMIIPYKDISWELVETVNKFAPFGEANPMPLFASTRLIVKRIMFMGGNKQHLKLSLADEFEDVEHSAIGFFMAEEWRDKLSVGEKVDMVYELGTNEWNGNREIQIKIKDLRLTNE